MAEDEALRTLIGFGRELRQRGLAVDTGRIMTFCGAAAALSPLSARDLYWAGRVSLVSRPEDVGPFDAAFDAYFRSPDATGLASIPEWVEAPEGAPFDTASVAGTALRDQGAVEAEPVTEEPRAAGVAASASEVLREKAFADLSEEERARVARLIRGLSVGVPMRRTRRLRPASVGTRFDVRRTIRRSLRTQGEPIERAWRSRGTRSRPLVLILDVSGSMAPYSRALMQFAFAAMAAGRRVEVFCFGTRLTRVTRTLRTKDPDRALHEIGRTVGDWEGGTRIGESLKTLLDTWGQRAALRGAVIVVCSDGLERGEPELLAGQMRRLRRLAHRVVWVNPLKGSPRYEPLARGMLAALPSVDVFVPGHNLESLEELARVLGD